MFRKTGFILSTLLCATHVSAALTEEQVRELSLSEGWLSLGHYRPTLLGGHLSQADDPTFFLAANGATDPTTELATAIHAFARPTSDDSHPQCRFPHVITGSMPR